MKPIKATMLLALVGMLPNVVRAQNISEIANSDPLVISGAVGTQNTYHYSSGSSYASPLSNTIYANLNISVYGFSMPFSLYFHNNNLDFNYPHLSFNLNPTYKSWTGHFGQSSMSFSNYVMNMSFNGVGIEYNDGKLRGGIFYGRLKKAVNDDPTDPLSRSPQYKRMGWGFKVGYGSGKNYVDLYLLRAYDCLNSLDEGWRNKVRPQENIVVGVKGCVTPLRWLSFSANAATSFFSTDTEAGKVPVTTSFDKVFDVRYTSLARFAGDANMTLSFKGFNTNVSYRLVQPDYTSLGTYYMSNNYQSLGISTSGSLFRKVALSATFNAQADNVTKKQLYTTKGFVYAATASTTLAKNLNISASYNGYLQTQGDGTVQVTDSSLVKRTMNSFTLTPSYTIDSEKLGHNISLSANYVTNKDLNKFANGESDVQTLAAGASYGLDVKPWEVYFNGTFSHQQSNGYKTRYSSDVLSLTASRSFLAEKNLNLSASVSWAYNEVRYQSKSLSMGCSFSANYTLSKVHMFSASASFNKYGDVNITKKRSNLDVTDISASLNYTYTLPIITIKSKKHRTEDALKKQRELEEKAKETLKTK